MNKQKIKSILYPVGLLLAGLLLGWLLFHPSSESPTLPEAKSDLPKEEVWTCSMHPQIRKDKPGKCPICAMDLIRLHQSTPGMSNDQAIHLTPEAIRTAGIRSSTVTKGKASGELRLFGKVETDERQVRNQVAYIGGRVEKLLVSYTGEQVRKGDPLAIIYSPELVTAQQELLESLRSDKDHPEITEAARQKLRQWKLGEDQIHEIETTGKIKTEWEIRATFSGIVTSRRINNGDYLSPGAVLFEITDLSRLWVLFDLYEQDMPRLQTGDRIAYSIQALPEKQFEGVLRFIDPVIDPTTRVARARVEIHNDQGHIKPGMFVTGWVTSGKSGASDKLILPKSAVLWTGKRSLVYVGQKEAGTFRLREVQLGASIGSGYVVTDGLKEGDTIVTEGTFAVDASAQLEGKSSMMNQESSLPPEAVTPSDPAVKEGHLHVAGNCDMCKERIEKVAAGQKGVLSAVWDKQQKILRFRYQSNLISENTLSAALAGAGHDTELDKASDAAYSALPECCLYRTP
ncbi:MAG: efflux RND transporter periplasmic adaptor subunit [Marinilabiliales bacterium]|nr:efflux RND transporter periplasmic adaptor subunit [Marinilabiliales bacterium]